MAGGRTDPSLRVLVRFQNKGLDAIDGHLELEWNLNLAGGGGNPQAYYRSNGSEARHDGRGSVSPGTVLSFGNEYEGVDIVASAEPAAEAAWYPVETISNSEAGFERIYQGSCLVYRWPLAVPTGGEASFSVRFEVAQTRDRAEEERSRK